MRKTMREAVLERMLEISEGLDQLSSKSMTAALRMKDGSPRRRARIGEMLLLGDARNIVDALRAQLGKDTRPKKKSAKRTKR